MRQPYFAAVLLAVTLLVAPSAQAGQPQPTRIARISLAVFGPRAPVARCIAHYESTDGAHLYNGPNLGPWQINVDRPPVGEPAPRRVGLVVLGPGRVSDLGRRQGLVGLVDVTDVPVTGAWGSSAEGAT